MKSDSIFFKLVLGVSLIGPPTILIYFLIANGQDTYTLDIDPSSTWHILGVVYYSIVVLFALGWMFSQMKGFLSIRKEKHQMELQQLQQQVSPHFLFNSLNFLYGFMESKPQEARAAILDMSELMRYSVDTSSKDQVPLQEEIDYIQNYLNLQKRRYHRDVDIKFATNLGSRTISIAPLLLIVLVENAFKHGVESLDSASFVHISLEIVEKQLVFEVKNNFNQGGRSEHKGIGLENLTRRLELLYPKKHMMQITDEAPSFTTILTLDYD